MNKDAMRKKLVEMRDTMDSHAAARSSAALVEIVRGLPEWRNADEVLLYWPVRNEVDLRPLMAEMWQRGGRVLLPRCRPEEKGVMDLAFCTCGDDLRPGMFSIMEPDAESCPAIESPAPRLALIPGVAFSRRGERMGFGGGYYDRFLSMPSMAETLTIGVCHSFQLVDALPSDPWDIPMRAVCTEENLWRI